VSRPPDFIINGFTNEHRHGITVEDLFLNYECGIMNDEFKSNQLSANSSQFEG
jgi:hypothetical protein